MRTLQTRDIPKYLLAAFVTGIILLAAPVGASAYTVVKRPKPPVAVDHRLDSTVTVRDHRAVPNVRDHRQQATSAGATSAKTTAARTYTPRKKKVVTAPTYPGGGILSGGR
jgi:hypothetical protein